MAVAAYSTTVKVAGTPIAMVGEACTSIDTTTFQITASVKRILDPRVPIVVKAAGVAQTNDKFTVNYLFGIIQFAVAPTAPVTVDASYLPTLTVLGAKGYTLTETVDLADSTDYQSGGYKVKTVTLFDCNGSLETLERLDTDLDPDAVNTMVLRTLRENGTPFLLEISPGGVAGDVFRAWVMLEGTETATSVDGLLENTLNFQSAPIQTQTYTRIAAFAWA